MGDPAINRLQRAVDDSKAATGMQTGSPKVTIDRADAERILLLLTKGGDDDEGRP